MESSPKMELSPSLSEEEPAKKIKTEESSPNLAVFVASRQPDLSAEKKSELIAKLAAPLGSSVGKGGEKRSRSASDLQPERGRLNYDRSTPNYRPEKVGVVAKVEEKTERYRIETSLSLEKQSWISDSWTGNPMPLLDERRMLSAGYCSAEEVEKLWAQKARIDSFFDTKGESFYYRARNSVFPQDQKGSDRYRNRAGDKLWEVDQAVGLFGQMSGVFFDVCGGPGAWSEVLLNDRNRKWRGFGMTLKLPDTPLSDMWYDHLMRDKRWQPLWGEDGTGNVYNHKNLEHAQAEVMRLEMPVTMVMADGGFHISTNVAGVHQEHLQEMFSARIILSELLACLKCLSEGGSWCCKLFDTFSHFTASIVYITALCFESTYIVKPFRSRIVNSERYLVGKRRRKMTDQFQVLIDHVTKIHASWSDDETDGSHPESLVPADVMIQDRRFFEMFSQQVRDLCGKQIIALTQVMDLAEELRLKSI